MSSSTSDSVREIEISSTISTDSRTSKTPSPALSEAGSCTALCVGGGVDGLIAGITLNAAGVDCHIFDQLGGPSDYKSPETGFQLTEELEMWLQAHNVKCKSIESAGRQVLDEEGEVVVEDGKELSYISWEGLYSALRKAFPAENFHPCSKVVAVDLSQVDNVSLELDSGEHYTGNLLLAADGINSGLRSQLLPSCQPTYSGYLAWRGMALLERLSPEAQYVLGNKSTLFKGLNLHIQAHPLPPSSTLGPGTPVCWTWFNNQEVVDLPGLIINRDMKIHPYSVPVGQLSRAVADAVAKAADGAMPAALAELITRNVTIEGVPGQHSVLDLDYQQDIVSLCSTCILTFANITIAQERHGMGAAVDFFRGTLQAAAAAAGSLVVMQNVYRLRGACTTPGSAVADFQSKPRSRFVGLGSAPTKPTVLDASLQGVPFPKSVHLQQYTEDVPLQTSEEGGKFGGYSLDMDNVTFLCRETVQESCLARKSADVCLHEILRELEAPELLSKPTSSSAAASSGQTGGINPIVVAVPVVLGVLLLAALAAAFIFFRRRKQRRRLRKLQGDAAATTGVEPSKGSTSAPNMPSAAASASGTYATSYDSAMEAGWMDAGVAGYKATGSSGQVQATDWKKPRGHWKGWQLYGTSTTPLINATDSPIEIGELLGAGSFGRVYRGRWANMAVAVKVIEHMSDTSHLVENEVKLQLSFAHTPYVDLNAPGCSCSREGSAAAGSDSGTFPLDSSSPPANCLTSASSPRKPLGQAPGQQFVSQTPPLPPRSAGNRARFAPLPGSAGSASRLQRSAEVSFGTQVARQESSDLESTSSFATSARLRRSMDSSVACKAETWIVMELCDCGSLYDVAAEWDPLQENDQQMLERLMLLMDAARGLEALHEANVVHGDLNARNVLVSSTSTTPLGMVAKLSDLGLSRVVKQHSTHRTTNTVGTMSHMPPELLRSGYMSPAVDVYSFGIMMWEIYTGQLSFKNVHYAAFYETVVLRNVRPFLPPDMPEDYRFLMEHCWAANPVDRPPIGKLLQCLDILISHRQAHAAAEDAKLMSEGQQDPGGNGFAAAAAAAAGPPDSHAGAQLLEVLGFVPGKEGKPAFPIRQSSCPADAAPPDLMIGDGSQAQQGHLVVEGTASRYACLSSAPGVGLQLMATPVGGRSAVTAGAAGQRQGQGFGTMGTTLGSQGYQETSDHINWFV
eukprot:gene3757-4016_t